MKARHLVLALHDHFVEESNVALRTIHEIANQGDTEGPSTDQVKEIIEVANRASHSASSEDRWAIEYISVYRVHALIEALDKDVSSFVTISEVNEFTAARPRNWRYARPSSITEQLNLIYLSRSLPHWIAYWTVG